MSDLLTADQRVAAGTAGVLTFVNVDADGEPVDATGDVTVTVTRADGTTVLPAGSATTPDDAEPGVYQRTLTPAETSELGLLTVTWAEADAGSFTTWAEVVGRHYVTLAEIRRAQPDLADPKVYPAARLARARLVAEVECERITGRSFVRRSRRLTIDGTGETSLFLPDRDVAAVRSVLVGGHAFTTAQLDALVPGDNLVERVGATWAEGRGNTVLVYEYGWPAPPADLRDALCVRIREIANQSDSGVPVRARSFNPESGGSFELNRGGRFTTGNNLVDAVYARFGGGGTGAEGDSAGSAAPVSRSLDLNPQFGSLFHGGRM